MATSTTALRRVARLRIIAVPLTSASRSARQQFVFYNFQTPPPDASRPISDLQKVVNKASDLWSGFGRAEEGSWKVRGLVFSFEIIPFFRL